MAAHKTSCPGCGLSLKVAQSLPANLRCPKCKARFHAPADGAATLVTDLPVLPAAARRIGVLAAVFGSLGLLLVLGGGVLVYCLLAPPSALPDGDDSDGTAAGGNRLQAINLEPVGFVKKAPRKGDQEIALVADGKPSPDAPPGVAKDVCSPESLLPANQKDIDAAIAKGVAYLQAGLDNQGRFKNNANGNRLGGAALIGLTLLSCGVSAEDSKIAGIAARVRAEAPNLQMTYDLACCIWFLDKLGNDNDYPLVRKLALRLIAGQGTRGGWNYNCSLLSPGQEEELLRLLADQPYLPTPVTGENPPPKNDPKLKPPPKGVNANRMAVLPADLKQLPVLQFQAGQVLSAEQKWWEDNSLTQFVMLALWAAQKHGVPAQRSLAMAEARFRQSQHPNGTWEYTWSLQGNVRFDSMTCAGLLGLAVGRGLDKSADGGRDLGKDPQVEKALLFLGHRIGLKELRITKEETDRARKELKELQARLSSAKAEEQPALIQRMKELQYALSPNVNSQGKTIHASAWGDLYFLWSVERVAVVYGLRTIGGKDWYAWGSEILVARQVSDGSWHDAFAGPVDTCFALLFLKRVNVAQDLTKVLQGLGGARDPGAKGTEELTAAIDIPGGNKTIPSLRPGSVKLRSGYALPGSTPRRSARRRRHGMKQQG
jgi:hypothetical protein